MNKLSSKILHKIRKENVTPRPRWYFVLIQILLGTAILTSVLIGAVAVAIVIRHFTMTDWEMARYATGGPLRSVIMLIPYIWLVLISVSILLAELLFKHTKKGHRINPWKMVAASIAVSVALGSLFFVTKADQPIEAGLRNNLRPYQQWKIHRMQVFIAPEKGVLAGRIHQIKSPEEWMLTDFRNKDWLVDISEARTPVRIEFRTGMDVGIIGEVTCPNCFRAIRVTPWQKEMGPMMQPREIRIRIDERKFEELP